MTDIVSAFEALKSIDACAISLLDSMTPTHSPNTTLLQGMPARDLNSATTALVKGLKDIDIERVNKSFNWWERATGKDLEQRARFDLATHEISNLIADMVQAHISADAARDAMLRDAENLKEVNTRLRTLIDLASSCAIRLSGEPFHVNRLKKRIEDMKTMVIANELFEAQYIISCQMLISLLDRTGEVVCVLLPLWKQHAFAVANAGVRDEREKSAMNVVAATQKKIFARLSVHAELAE